MMPSFQQQSKAYKKKYFQQKEHMWKIERVLRLQLSTIESTKFRIFECLKSKARVKYVVDPEK